MRKQQLLIGLGILTAGVVCLLGFVWQVAGQTPHWKQAIVVKEPQP